MKRTTERETLETVESNLICAAITVLVANSSSSRPQNFQDLCPPGIYVYRGVAESEILYLGTHSITENQ